MSLRLRHPLPGGTPTSGFGWRAAIPGVIGPELHNGQDYAAPLGTPIRAAHSGVVRYSGWDTAGGGGWIIRIGAARCTTIYAHMQARSTLTPGQAVKAGQIIGYVGSTGASTGPHLHFILILHGSPVDPVPYLKASIPTMTEAQMKRLLAAQTKELIEAIPKATLDYKVKRPDNPGRMTSLRALIMNSPRRHVQVREWAARLLRKPTP